MKTDLIKMLRCIILGSFLVSGCQGTFSQKQEFRSIETDKATSVEVTIRLNEGGLLISPGIQQLMNARFDYLQPTRRPDVKYEEQAEKGMLLVQQVARSSVGEFAEIGEKNQWHIFLHKDVPLTLNIEVDQGKSLLNLGALNTGRVYIEAGRGDIFLNLQGERSQNLFVTARRGEGFLEIMLPAAMGVRVRLDECFDDIQMEGFTQDGEYLINEAYSPTDVFIDILIGSHKGPIRFIYE